ncbi:Hypothetical Protein FCC1311_021572 [Hondaea fermentalgiana]|uniref:Uncharacterized protein n=1 Tax=Hondaea fermentalgiana TaxID=2315210 RepID=A0A2R5G819_9STRA|nr:Hypothetical Protein FCC1311_021572 [Hondaea fermentalgiana]|eukprot:GBG25938.1 Hypothetical Protein FCC1311_021572 [Hondaea fermentalgiana]
MHGNFGLGQNEEALPSDADFFDDFAEKAADLVGSWDSVDDSPSPAPTSGRAKKRVTRRTYSEFEKELIVRADNEGGRPARLEVAQLMGMPARTADRVVALFKEHGREAFRDHRHDRYRHTGKNSKNSAELIKFLTEWVHLDAMLTHAQLRELINLEVFRRSCIDFGVKLENEEDKMNRPISKGTIERYFGLPQIRETYEARHIESDETIRHWFDGLVLSRKYVLDSAEAVNDNENCANRLHFARDLLTALEDPNSILIFLDEVPFHLRMKRPPGPQSGSINQGLQVSMAFQANMGLLGWRIHAQQFSAEEGTTGNAATDSKRGVAHNEEDFKLFVQQTLKNLLVRIDEFRGKDVYLIADCPFEYIRHVHDHESIKEIPAFEELSAALALSNNRVRLIQMAPNSPTLNLCEFFNRALRDRVNETLQNISADSVLSGAFFAGQDPNATLLESLLASTLRDLERTLLPYAPAYLVRMADVIKDIIALEGVLDMAKTYDALVA